MPLKWRLVSLFALLVALAMTAGGATLVINARAAVRAEMDAALALAVGLAGSGNGAAASLGELGLRHIRVLPGRAPSDPAAAAGHPPEDGAPGWFIALIGVEPQERQLPGLTIVAEPWDEIAEVWEDVTSLGAVMLALSAGLLAVLVWAAGRVLRPLTAFERGLERLRAGDFSNPGPLDGGGVPELARIGARIAALTDGLRRAEAENRRLGLQLVQVQDRERRELAREIHDELGASLFSLKIDAGHIRRNSPVPEVAERARAILATVESLHQLSRRVLTRLRPVVLDHVPLSEVLREMVAAERRRVPVVAWDFTIDGDIDGLEEPLRLTVYRLIQEGVTNALRHADPSRIAVGVARHPGPPGLEITVTDDGAGVGAGGEVDGDERGGFGLSGMAERVHALGGRLVVAARRTGGTEVRATIPVPPAPAAPLSCTP